MLTEEEVKEIRLRVDNRRHFLHATQDIFALLNDREELKAKIAALETQKVPTPAPLKPTRRGFAPES